MGGSAETWRRPFPVSRLAVRLCQDYFCRNEPDSNNQAVPPRGVVHPKKVFIQEKKQENCGRTHIPRWVWQRHESLHGYAQHGLVCASWVRTTRAAINISRYRDTIERGLTSMISWATSTNYKLISKFSTFSLPPESRWTPVGTLPLRDIFRNSHVKK